MRLTLSVVVAVLLLCRAPAAALGSLVKVWIEEKAPKVVWGQYAGRRSAALFDTSVPTADRFTPASGWRISRFSAAALSPDARRIGFKALGATSSAVGIYGVETGQAQILDTACDARELVWSPDGRYLAVEDSQGKQNNAVRVMGYDNDSSEMEISGDVLSDLGYSSYRFLNKGRGDVQDIRSIQVFAPRWTSPRSLSFKLKKVHSKGDASEESQPEEWVFDLSSKKFSKN